MNPALGPGTSASILYKWRATTNYFQNSPKIAFEYSSELEDPKVEHLKWRF